MVFDALFFLHSKSGRRYKQIFFQTAANYGFMPISNLKVGQEVAINSYGKTNQGGLIYLLKLNQNQNTYYEI